MTGRVANRLVPHRHDGRRRVTRQEAVMCTCSDRGVGDSLSNTSSPSGEDLQTWCYEADCLRDCPCVIRTACVSLARSSAPRTDRHLATEPTYSVTTRWRSLTSAARPTGHGALLTYSIDWMMHDLHSFCSMKFIQKETGSQL